MLKYIIVCCCVEMTIKKRVSKPDIFCIFATAYARNVSGCKKSIALTVLSQKIRQFYEGGRSILLSLVVYAIVLQHTVQA